MRKLESTQLTDDFAYQVLSVVEEILEWCAPAALRFSLTTF